MVTTGLEADSPVISPLAQHTLRKLLRVWFAFERSLSRTPIIHRLDQGTFNTGDYQSLLSNLRPQVIEGSRWISRAASSFDADHSTIRSVVINHALEEHQDYELIEEDFVALGGSLEDIRARRKNVGSEALHGFLMYRASLPNPTDLIGAMWIIEGLGNKMAVEWAERIEEITQRRDHTRFLRYHAQNDDRHMAKLYKLLDEVCKDETTADTIITTAKVVARLYCLQLEMIDHD